MSAHGVVGLGSVMPNIKKLPLKGVASIIPKARSNVLEKEGAIILQINILKMRDISKESKSRIAH